MVMKKNALRILAVLVLLGATAFAGSITINNPNFAAISANGCGSGYVSQYDSGSTSCSQSPTPNQNLNGVTGIGWTFSDSSAWTPSNGVGSGLTVPNSPFNPPSFAGLPQGTQAAFLQGQNSSVSQQLSGFTTGQSYNLSFYLGSRYNNGDAFNGNQTVEALIFNTLTDTVAGSKSWTLTSSTPFTLENLSFTANGTNETLEFVGQTYGDHTAFLTAASITATPEPVTLVLFGSGLVGIGGMMRRRLIG
jgi:hypothetical protein